MQANDFEKRIRDKMEGFELVPNGEVWKQVSGKINKESSRRRILFLWLFIAFVLLSGITSWWFINRQNSGSAIIEKADNKSSAITRQKAGTQASIEMDEKQEVDAKKRAPDHPTVAEGSVGKVAPGKGQKGTFQKAGAKASKKPVSSKKQLNITSTEKKLVSVHAGIVNIKAFNTNPLKEKADNLLPHKFYKLDQQVTASDNGIQVKGTKNDTAGIVTRKASVKQKRLQKGWKPGFTIDGGISDNRSGLPLVVSQSVANDLTSFPNQLSAGGLNNNRPPQLITFKPGFSFGLGLFAAKQLNKSLGLTAGADYRFFSASSMIGNKVNSQGNFFDSASRQSTLVSRYYQGGQSVTYLNTWHLVEIPVQLQLSVNEHTKKVIKITAAVVPGFLIGSNALYYNERERVFYPKTEQFRRFQVSARTGVLFTVHTSGKYYINAGPVFQYGLTNLTRAVTNSNQHLISAGIKANINLK